MSVHFLLFCIKIYYNGNNINKINKHGERVICVVLVCVHNFTQCKVKGSSNIMLLSISIYVSCNSLCHLKS